jgi:hypothetical protein
MPKGLFMLILVVLSGICKSQNTYLYRAEQRHKMLLGTWIFTRDTTECIVFEKDSIRSYTIGKKDTAIHYYSMTSAYITPKNENLSYTPAFRIGCAWVRTTYIKYRNEKPGQLGSVPVKSLTENTLEMNWDCNPSKVNDALVYKRKK